MAIKLKKINRSNVTKVILFILTVLMLTSAVTWMESAIICDSYLETLFVEQYKESSDYRFYYYDIINELLSEKPVSRDLKQENYVYYLLKKDGTTKSNVRATTKQYFENYSPYYFLYEEKNYTLGTVDENQNKIWIPNEVNQNVDTIYISFEKSYMNTKEEKWEHTRNEIIFMMIFFSIVIILSLVFIIMLMLSSGRNNEDENLHFSRFDEIYSDFQLCIGGATIGFWLYFTTMFMENIGMRNTHMSADQILQLGLLAFETATTITIGGVILLSLSRKFKDSRLVKHSLIFVICYGCYDLFKSLLDGRAYSTSTLTKNLFYRQVAFVIGSMAQVFFAFVFFNADSSLFIFPIIIEFVFVYWYINSNNKTYEEIDNGIDAGIEERLKAERMKVDLVTNVSHDLKTPLTSIISYVDLLSKEELTEAGKDYVKILGEKSERLKKIVEDLFDLSKSTSGSMSLDLENIDVKKLIEQTVADMSDAIVQSERKIVKNLPEHPIIIMADGDKLYRVFQNVLDNALKYSLENTRIYLNLWKEGNKVIASIKNIASYEMDLD